MNIYITVVTRKRGFIFTWVESMIIVNEAFSEAQAAHIAIQYLKSIGFSWHNIETELGLINIKKQN